MEDNNTVEAEIVEDDFKAPILQDIKYPVTEDALEALVAKYADVPNIDLEANEEEVGEQYQFVLAGHKAFVKERNKIEKTRKAIKDPAYTFGKNVDAFAKKLQGIIKGTEDKLKIQRDRVEQNEARKQHEAEEAEEQRISSIRGKVEEIRSLPLKYINSTAVELQVALDEFDLPLKEIFEEFFDEALQVTDLSLSQLRATLETKIKAEKAEEFEAERAAEAKKQQEEHDTKLQAERDKLAEEQAEFKRQKDEFEAQQRAVHEEADRKTAEEEADELMKKQEQEQQDIKSANEKMYFQCRDNTVDVLTTIMPMKRETAYKFIDQVMNNEIPNIKWVQDGN